MRKYTRLLLLVALTFILGSQKPNAQTCEWRYGNPTYLSLDPDGAGPATGVVSFTLQIHTISGTILNANTIGTGFSYQSSKLMLPTTVSCFVAGNVQPSNITMSPAFQAAGFAYTTVNFCNNLTPLEMTGGQGFDRRTSGTMEGIGINITTAWQDVFTVTMWSLGTSYPEGGHVIINAGLGGVPTPIVNNWTVATASAEYFVNSPDYASPLALGSALPVSFSKFEAKCTNTGTVVTWTTQQEMNSSHFELERSIDGNNWNPFSTVAAAGNSSIMRNYQQVDLEGGPLFYRIKQIDKDGQFIYTNVAKSNCDVKNISSLLYPVPARDVLNIIIKSNRSANTQLMIYDLQGKLVTKVNAAVVSGTNNFRINVSALAAGQYLLRSNDPVLNLNKTFTITR